MLHGDGSVCVSVVSLVVLVALFVVVEGSLCDGGLHSLCVCILPVVQLRCGADLLGDAECDVCTIEPGRGCGGHAFKVASCVPASPDVSRRAGVDAYDGVRVGLPSFRAVCGVCGVEGCGVVVYLGGDTRSCGGQGG